MKKTSQGTLPYQLICKTNNKVSCEEAFTSFQLALDKLTQEKSIIKPCSFEAKIYYFHNNKKTKTIVT